MKKACFPAVLLIFLLLPLSLSAQVFETPLHRTQKGDIYVSSKLKELPPKFVADIQNGIEKEIEFNVELMRVWDSWLDEYVVGKTIVRTIKYDVVKKQYYLTSLEGRYLYEKTLENRSQALDWFTQLNDVLLARTKDVQRGTYYVRVRMQSRRIKMPALLKVLLFFVPEVEFEGKASGATFPLNK